MWPYKYREICVKDMVLLQEEGRRVKEEEAREAKAKQEQESREKENKDKGKKGPEKKWATHSALCLLLRS